MRLKESKMHKAHSKGHHGGVKHAGAHEKNSWHGDKQPKSGSHKPIREPGVSGNGCAHMSWKGHKDSY